MLLYLEGCALFLHLKAEDDVEVHVFCGGLLVIFAVHIIFGVVGVLDKISRVLPVAVAHAERGKLLVHVVFQEIFACEVDHRTCVASLVDDEE